IFGQHTFFELTATLESLFEARGIPTPTTPFESTAVPLQQEFFGRPNQFFTSHNLFLGLNLFHGDAAFKPADWRIQITPAFNLNHTAVEELGIISPDVRQGGNRLRTFGTVQEWFVEKKIADLSPYYDFVSIRVGTQPFISDFRGFIFNDVNRGVRLFGN